MYYIPPMIDSAFIAMEILQCKRSIDRSRYRGEVGVDARFMQSEIFANGTKREQSFLSQTCSYLMRLEPSKMHLIMTQESDQDETRDVQNSHYGKRRWRVNAPSSDCKSGTTVLRSLSLLCYHRSQYSLRPPRFLPLFVRRLYIFPAIFRADIDNGSSFFLCGLLVPNSFVSCDR